MKWYWPVGCDNTVKNPFVSDSGDLRGFEYWDFAKGKDIEPWDDTTWIKASAPENDGDPDDVLQNHLGLEIYSLRLRDTLINSGITAIQYLPIRVLRPDDRLLSGFAIANILNVVSALDPAKSIVERYPEDYFLPDRRGNIRSLRKVSLKQENLDRYDIVRLKEYEVNIYVSERFKNAFEFGGFTGYSFHEVDVSDRTVKLTS